MGIDDNKIRALRPAALQRELAKTNPNVVVSADVVNYGFMPELVARTPVIIEYYSLSDNDLLQIMNIAAVSSIEVWREHFKLLGKTLVVTEDAKRYAVEKAQFLKMGARGLQQVMFQALAGIAFDVESSQSETYTVTAQNLCKWRCPNGRRCAMGSIPPFNQYSSSRIFTLLADIRDFQLFAEVPPIGRWSDDAFARGVVDKLYDKLRDIVGAAGFFYEDLLKSTREVEGVQVDYPDDRFEFGVVCTEKAVIIKRSGSRLSNFHDWYTAFMPSAQDVLTKATTILSEESGREIKILRTSFRFSFLIHDIEAETTHKGVRNSEIMSKLLKGFPDDQGTITESPHVLASLGRVDVNMTRWIGEEGNRRRLRFSVEAPGNLAYSTLWFTFEYMGETYAAPEGGRREAFNPNEFLTEYEQAYVTFLRDNAINGFMEWLLRGYYFKSTAGSLP